MTDKRREDETSLAGLASYAPELAAAIAAIASDIAFVIDDQGIICNAAAGTGGLHSSLEAWVGRRWADTVTSDTRRKVDLLLKEANSTGVSKRREVNHPVDNGADIPMTYAAIRLGEHGPVLVAGRDLRAISAIQQRFIESQREMERSYWVQRQAEAHYRLLFQVATDAVLVVDARSNLVVDANPAARNMLARGAEGIVGAAVTSCVDVRSRPSVEDMLATARSSGKPAELKVRLSAQALFVVISATPFRGEHDMLLLLRMSLVDHQARFESAVLPVSSSEPDPVVITDSSGRVVMTNPAFVALVGATTEAQLKGQPLSVWVAGFDQQLNSVLDKINRQGIASRSTCVVRQDNQGVIDVELSAALLTGGEQLHIGVSLRPCSSALAAVPLSSDDLSQTIRALSLEFGHLSLDQLLLRVGALAEQHFVAKALAKTDGDQAAAARLLRVPAGRVQERDANDEEYASAPPGSFLH